ncbi:MAG TPA: DUF523 and DUF1722 domain-containing protein [Desulfuromonadales bacterium]|nr:DUF523 and DUF1722 domain-containing protein [Desulfuromonadales bacterium]
MEKIRLGISACLLGQQVRYDGGHKRDTFLTGTLAEYVDYVPVCPEVEIGLPTPREALRLVGDSDNPRLITQKTGIDYTERMQDWAAVRLQALEKEELCGFIFKSRSPSSGMERVKVYGKAGGMPAKTGVGVFARAFMEHFPLLPVEEEGRMHDHRLRENFIECIFAFQRWRELLQQDKTPRGLIGFHTRHKLQLLSHSPEIYRRLGKLVAAVKEYPVDELFELYQQAFIRAMRLKTTVKKNVNVLQHMLGYFKRDLSGDEKQECLQYIDRYAKQLVPLLVPLTLIDHYVRKYDQNYLQQQTYLFPAPLELKLRNHA